MNPRLILPVAAFMSLLSGQSYQADSLRQAYMHSLDDAEFARQWYVELSASQPGSGDVLTLGYLGAQLAVLAKHDPLPWRKLQHLRLAEVTVHHALALEPGHPEIHFLRFSYQHNIPGFLGLSDELDSDRLLLVRYLTSPPDGRIDRQVAGDMAAFLIDSGRCTPREIQRLRSVFP